MPILDESRMTLQEAAAYCSRDVQTIRNWIAKGYKGTKLEALRIGAQIVTSQEALRRFIATTNGVQGN
jgi:hypothetical protein